MGAITFLSRRKYLYLLYICVLIVTFSVLTITLKNFRYCGVQHVQTKNSSAPVPCHKSGYFSMFHGGQLGNQMSHYATLFAHSKRLGVKTVLQSATREILTKHFPNISIAPAADDCDWNWTKMYVPAVYGLTPADFETQNIMIDWFVFDFEGFRFYQHELITQEFRFDPLLVADGKNFLANIQKQSHLKVIFVSIHVRRTDYKKWMSYQVNGFVASQKFYLAAMDIYREKYNSNQTLVKFVMASDDDEWCRKMFAKEQDVVFTSSYKSFYSNIQPTFDLALLSQCNHSIFSLGTFGFWTAYLKGSGDAIIVTGTSRYYPYVESNLRPYSQHWIFLQDPCYEKDNNSQIRLLDECQNLN